MNIEFPEGPPGIHPPTAALKRILQINEVKNPITGEPFSEALLLGIGGGLDIGSILFQFKHLPNPILMLGFRNQWNHTQAFFNKLIGRLDLNASFYEFDGPREAQKSLQDILKQGRIAIVWVDKALLPHHALPKSLQGYVNHQVAVHARDGRLWRLYIDDLSTRPIEIREKTFTAARGNIPQNNFRMMVFNHANGINARELRESIIEGMRDCAMQLNNPIKTIGISNLETWAEKLTDRSDHLGWSQVFKDQKGLFLALQTIYESIKLDGTGGFALRKFYSDFLHESASYLGNPSLNAVAGQYLQLSNHWSNLAEYALPSSIPEFDKIKNLLNKKYEAYRNHDINVNQKAITDLNTLRKEITADFPLDMVETARLFERLSGQIKLIAELERSAALRLRDISRK